MSASAVAGCVYCGLPRARVRSDDEAVTELPACRGHDDLLGVDPAYDLAGHLAAISYPALALDPSPSASRREGSPSPLLRPLAPAPGAG